MEEPSKQYNPHIIEEKWYYFWERKGFFHADPLSDKEPFCMVMPPPNVTGALHMGHALINTLQDIIIRWKRMLGYETLWVPGVDHAGISTQTVVERFLIATKGKRRKDYSREAFLSHIWNWKKKHETTIVNQLKKLGCSCDWMRHRFTMDKSINQAVRLLFKKLYEDQLIYRGDYLVNWDPISQTALADDEVEYEEKKDFLYYIRYPIKESHRYVTIATTRPETMLADVAIAISPKDKRYTSFLGEHAVLPIVGRKLPILADPFVNPKFGTGAVKITPAHDFNDYEMGQSHHLEMINLLNPDATLNKNGLEYEGMTTQEARKHIIARLKEENLIEKIEPHTHRVGISYRSKALIEPYLSKQWFIKMSAFKDKLIDAIRLNHIKIFPESWQQIYFHWIENLRDWCISRQLWWGHRIPIWYKKEDPSQMICYSGEDLPPQIKKEKELWVQDEDVLDTWFSSALWPFTVLGYPHETNELKKFYPNQMLLTGHDILFFWVARMIMMGEYAMNKLPFTTVSLQGLIYGKSYWRQDDKGNVAYVSLEEKKKFDLSHTLPKGVFSKWEKMSKSKGNILDPLEIITEYGTDAMRMSLAASATSSMQIDLDRRRFEEFKNFANKVWNGFRFIFIHIKTLEANTFSQGLHLEHLGLEDLWIFSSLNKTIKKMNDFLANYQFERAAFCIYTFFWDQFCAYYLEIAKPALYEKIEGKAIKQKVLVLVLLATIRLMHPIAPFITEEIFQLIKRHFGPFKETSTPLDPYTKEALQALLSSACIVAPYPQVICQEDQKVEETFALLIEIIHALRNIRAEMGLAPQYKSKIILQGKKSKVQFFLKYQNIIASLVPLDTLEYEPQKTFSAIATVKGLKLIIPLPKELAEKEKIRLEKEKSKYEKQMVKLHHQLNNPDFINRAPKELVENTKLKLKKIEENLKTLEKKSAFFEKP